MLAEEDALHRCLKWVWKRAAKKYTINEGTGMSLV